MRTTSTPDSSYYLEALRAVMATVGVNTRFVDDFVLILVPVVDIDQSITAVSVALEGFTLAQPLGDSEYIYSGDLVL